MPRVRPLGGCALHACAALAHAAREELKKGLNAVGVSGNHRPDVRGEATWAPAADCRRVRDGTGVGRGGRRSGALGGVRAGSGGGLGYFQLV
ncbi:hypothetical protein PF005_g5876 [Phytophthora fragariae]|uniref:Uncharacterized protein n=1 Tax=Phytophthora fragariae TaxID=53985 RepID=A0A6A3FFD3_9STRA|nr:hypothetical protein PF003_g19355 [Phytophthora fragariae]KAE8943912.1 hypothetical protein PF009_g6389 [Phytophthora fragariae]KAE9014667.1 hypothetical protein PF011_g7952 [Phytophthora fragariae]KAE9117945.1 hypothetical protein PF007_g9099 [Phytophthora fragariae]KAE9147021.1 hypothetical protein PF006_g8266 [Phytophthora fragariae]